MSRRGRLAVRFFGRCVQTFSVVVAVNSARDGDWPIIVIVMLACVGLGVGESIRESVPNPD